MSAINTVFSIAELVEEILDQATMNDVLLLRRINTFFMRTIKESPRLQQKLFLKPVKYATTRHLRQADLDPTPNTLLLSAMGIKYSPTSRILDAKPGTHDNDNEPKIDEIMTIFHNFDLHAKHPRERRKALKPGSWNKMLLLQPPIHTNLEVKCSVVERHGEIGLNRDLRKGQEPAMWSALQDLVSEMAKQSRELRGLVKKELGSGLEEVAGDGIASAITAFTNGFMLSSA
ncbi:hypothetical protein LTR95_003827 [Oleoguttula sp. CCFEE 5521]